MGEVWGHVAPKRAQVADQTLIVPVDSRCPAACPDWHFQLPSERSFVVAEISDGASFNS